MARLLESSQYPSIICQSIGCHPSSCCRNSYNIAPILHRTFHNSKVYYTHTCRMAGAYDPHNDYEQRDQYNTSVFDSAHSVLTIDCTTHTHTHDCGWIYVRYSLCSHTHSLTRRRLGPVVVDSAASLLNHTLLHSFRCNRALSHSPASCEAHTIWQSGQLAAEAPPAAAVCLSVCLTTSKTTNNACCCSSNTNTHSQRFRRGKRFACESIQRMCACAKITSRLCCRRRREWLSCAIR